MDTQQRFTNPEDLDKLLEKNLQLKKELEREKALHTMLYNEWKQLSEQMAARDQEVYENSKPKNLFYKYAFFVLLAAGISASYWTYSHIGGQAKIPPAYSSSQVISDSVADAADSASASSPLSVNDSQSIQKSTAALHEKPLNSSASKQQTAIAPPVVQPLEKKVALTDSSKKVKPTISRPLVEKPLTDDERDSISSNGFSAYFDHRRNPYRKSSERYKVWAEGWSEGKAEAIKVVEKNPSLKH